MSAPRELQDLIADVVRTYPSARLEFDPLPSGVCFLWVEMRERNFVIEYSPGDGTGVSENFPDTPPFVVGHDEAFKSLADGVGRFKAIRAEAARKETATAMVLHDKE